MDEVAQTHIALRQFEQADAVFERALAVAPDIDSVWISMAGIELFGRGSISGARAILERWPGSNPTGFLEVFRLERDWTEYLAAAEALPRPDPWRQLLIGQAHTGLGNESEARAAFEKVEQLIPNSEDLDSSPYL